jgi:ATP-dependent HslUV protease ATP-binding subunit HslU
MEFRDSAIDEIARLAVEVNTRTENIGARRLHTILTTLLDDILFSVPDEKPNKIVVTRKMVRSKLSEIVEDEDLSKYIL